MTNESTFFLFKKLISISLFSYLHAKSGGLPSSPFFKPFSPTSQLLKGFKSAVLSQLSKSLGHHSKTRIILPLYSAADDDPPQACVPGRLLELMGGGGGRLKSARLPSPILLRPPRICVCDRALLACVSCGLGGELQGGSGKGELGKVSGHWLKGCLVFGEAGAVGEEGFEEEGIRSGWGRIRGEARVRGGGLWVSSRREGESCVPATVLT